VSELRRDLPNSHPRGVRLQHAGVTFTPGGEDAIRAFYGGVLGLEELEVPPPVADRGWIWFATRDPGIELHFIPSELPPDPQRRHHFCLEVPGLAELRARLEREGAEIRAAGGRIPGRERLFTRDPVGNLVELLEMTG
jgi:catechol 2,3-dioxygenase-like lactoylglutathione lyase family enzyme